MLGTPEVIAVTLLSAAIAAFAQYLYKKSVKRFEFSAKSIIGTFRNSETVVGLASYVISLGVYLYALSSAPVISFIYPVFASTFVFVLLISRFVLKEKINKYRVAGVLCIILGITLISTTL
jgi:multidrug transporter EmrE-like cation transporter